MSRIVIYYTLQKRDVLKLWDTNIYIFIGLIQMFTGEYALRYSCTFKFKIKH